MRCRSANSTRTSTPLHAALINGQIELAHKFIEQGLLLNDQDESGETPLFLAVEFQDLFELLLNVGADVNISNDVGETPLHEVAENGTVTQCRLLLEHGANIHAQDHRKQSPLHAAAAYGHHEMVKLLIDHGADVNSRDAKGKTPLHYAVYGNIMQHELNDHLETAEVLIRAGADLAAQTNDSETPLELAKRHFGYPELAALFVRHAAK